MYAESPSSRSPFTLARSPGSVFIVVSTPSVPTTVVMPQRTISLRKNSGVCELNPFSPLPPSRCWCGSTMPGVSTQPVPSITSCSTPSASRPRRSTSPIFAMAPFATSTDFRPSGAGA
jgi:hypothetical protein